MNRPPLSLLPEGVQREMLNSAFALGRAQLAPWALNNVNVVGRARLAGARRILENGKSLQLQFPAEDIGFRYSAGALVNEQPVKDSGGGSLTGQANERCQAYIPSSEPGSRLPHVTFAALDSPDKTFSSIDLPGSHGLAFLLFVSESTEGQGWARKVNAAWKKVNVPLAYVNVSQEVSQRQQSQDETEISVYDGQGDAPAEDPGPRREATRRSDFPWRERSRELQVLDVNGEFWSTCGVSARGALLVRPDGHVAWRCDNSPDVMEDFALEEVLSEIWK